MFLQSQNNPAKDPIVVWYNGGPGCSSLDGLLYEHGPFLINEDGATFTKNKYSWNTVANVLYVEAPIGVGFSYSDSGNYEMDDKTTASDNANALEDFFRKFPELHGRDVFITGESYGGVYVPSLAQEIMSRGTATPIRLKGFAVGNGLADYKMNDNSLIFFAYYHGLLSDSLWDDLTRTCCAGGVANQENCDFHSNSHPDCTSHVSDAMNLVYSAGLNFYNLYGDCISTPTYKRSLSLIFANQTHHESARRKHLQSIQANVPCIDSKGANIWLNKQRVQKALHVKMNGKWAICSDILNYNRQYTSMLSIYQDLFQTYKLPGVSYNGDTDMACNFLGNQWFANMLSRPVVKARSPWKLEGDAQVSGFKTEYDLLTFYTVKGAGHMVPQWYPKQAMQILLDLLYKSQHKKRRFFESKLFS